MAGVITKTAMTLQKTSEDMNEVLGEWKFISYKTRRLMNRIEEKVINGDLFKLF
jgi:hypothetical protein